MRREVLSEISCCIYRSKNVGVGRGMLQSPGGGSPQVAGVRASLENVQCTYLPFDHWGEGVELVFGGMDQRLHRGITASSAAN